MWPIFPVWLTSMLACSDYNLDTVTPDTDVSDNDGNDSHPADSPELGFSPCDALENAMPLDLESGQTEWGDL
jgi:hypothetical protein